MKGDSDLGRSYLIYWTGLNSYFFKFAWWNIQWQLDVFTNVVYVTYL